MKYFLCPEDPDGIPFIEAEDITEAKKEMCTACIEASPENFECDGPIEADPSEIPAIKASKNLLENIGAYIHEMKECIQALILAIDSSTLCKECCDKGIACSECPWFKAKNRAIELLKEVE